MHPSPYGVSYGEYPSVGGLRQLVHQLCVGEILRLKVVDTYLQGSDPFEQSLLEVAADGHYLSCGLHLGAQVSVHGAELVEWPPGDLHDHIVQGGLEGGAGVPGYLVRDLVKSVSDRYLGGYAGYRVPRCLGCQRRGPRHSGVHFYETIFLRLGVQSELDIAPAFYPEGAYDLYRCGPEALMIVV